MIYEHPPKRFYAFNEWTESFYGFDELEEAMAQAKTWEVEDEDGPPIFVFETKASLNTAPLEPSPEEKQFAERLALIPPPVREGRRSPTPEELNKMPPNWVETWREYWRRKP